jgi:glycosyltransferase involved in cell wall biosynthesis
VEQQSSALDAEKLADAFDADYFAHHCGPVPYERNESFVRLFDHIAENIDRELAPKTVFDAGCAIGLLVESLRKRGIEAYGNDISEFAISQVPEPYREFCAVGSVTEPLGRRYDLITCIEVLEHLRPEDAKQAVENLCQHTDDILFSSSPFDYKEISHVNVHPPEYWVELFARHDFYRDVEFDGAFLTPWAVRLRRRRDSIPRVVAPYERRLWQLLQENGAGREVILEQRNELLQAEAKAQARVDAETARLREDRDEILAELRANHTAYIRAALTRNAAHNRQVAELNQAINVNQETAARTLAERTAELTAQITAARREAEELSRCAVSLFFALEATDEAPSATPVERLLTRKQRPIPLTPVASDDVARIRSGRQSLWYFAKTAGPLTFRAELKPGRYVLRLKAMASEPIELQVSAGEGQPRALGQLDRRISRLTIPFDVAKPSQELKLSLPRPVPLALVGGFTLFREIDESPTRIIRRRLLSGARRLPMARRLARSRVGQVLRSAPEPAPPSSAAQPTDALTFAPWMQDRLRERQPLYRVTPKPGLLSLLTSAWNTPVEYLDALAKSVFGQWDYPSFEWIVLDNGSTNPETIACIQGLARHPQVKVFRVEANLGIVGGMRYCLERATGRYVLPLDSDDYLYPDCLRIMAWHIEQYGYPPLLYSDEDKIQGGQFRDEYLKPDWDPVLFLNSCYIAHFDAIDRELALALGAYSDPGAEGCHDWDTFIRFMLARHTPLHVPEVVYSWRMHPESAAQDIMSKSYIYSSHEHVLGKYLAAQPHPERYRVELSPLFNGYPEWWFRRTHTDPRPLLSLILSRDPDRVDTRAVLEATDYPDHRVQAISVSGGREEITRLAAEQHELGGLIHLQYEDVQVEGNEWPWEAQAIMELHSDTMIVGGRIVDGAGQIIAAGEYFGYGGDSGCPDLGRPLGHPGYFGQLWKQRSVCAVSSMLTVIDAHFLIEFLRQDGYDRMSLPFLGAWAGIYARWSGKRVVYSPFLLGRCEAGRAAWDELILPAEREAFGRMNRDMLPDTRFLSPLISLDPTVPPYTAVSAAQRLATAPSGPVLARA